MNELIGIAVLVASLYGGTLVAEKVYYKVRLEALTRAAQGLPELSPFANILTKGSRLRRGNR